MTIIAFVTMYGATGRPMSDGKMPHVGAAACPRNVSHETIAIIDDVPFVCEDRTAKQYNGRFDLFSTASNEKMLKFGKQRLKVTLCKN